jgi:hypothetical protein
MRALPVNRFFELYFGSCPKSVVEDKLLCPNRLPAVSQSRSIGGTACTAGTENP